jgi:hypothetical protein
MNMQKYVNKDVIYAKYANKICHETCKEICNKIYHICISILGYAEYVNKEICRIWQFAAYAKYAK